MGEEDDDGIRAVLKAIRRRASFHAEDEYRLRERMNLRVENDPSSHPVWRDATAALMATQRLVKLARETGKRIHILHVTTKDEAAFLAGHKDVANTKSHIAACLRRQGRYADAEQWYRDALAIRQNLNSDDRDSLIGASYNGLALLYSDQGRWRDAAEQFELALNLAQPRAKPDDLPSAIELDISPLVDFDAVLHASDLVMPPGVTLVTEPTEALARVQQPRIEEEPVAAVPAEGAEAEEGAAGEPKPEGGEAAPETAAEENA